MRTSLRGLGAPRRRSPLPCPLRSRSRSRPCRAPAAARSRSSRGARRSPWSGRPAPVLPAGAPRRRRSACATVDRGLRQRLRRRSPACAASRRSGGAVRTARLGCGASAIGAARRRPRRRAAVECRRGEARRPAAGRRASRGDSDGSAIVDGSSGASTLGTAVAGRLGAALPRAGRRRGRRRLDLGVERAVPRPRRRAARRAAPRLLERRSGTSGGVLVLALGQLELLAGEVRVVDDVADVEEGGLVQADVDEGRLHAREHPDHAALVDVADDALVLLTLEIELGDVAVLDERDAGLAAGRVDDEDAAHGGTPCARIRTRRPPDGWRRNRAVQEARVKESVPRVTHRRQTGRRWAVLGHRARGVHESQDSLEVLWCCFPAP